MIFSLGASEHSLGFVYSISVNTSNLKFKMQYLTISFPLSTLHSPVVVTVVVHSAFAVEQ